MWCGPALRRRERERPEREREREDYYIFNNNEEE